MLCKNKWTYRLQHLCQACQAKEKSSRKRCTFKEPNLTTTREIKTTYLTMFISIQFVFSFLVAPPNPLSFPLQPETFHFDPIQNTNLLLLYQQGAVNLRCTVLGSWGGGVRRRHLTHNPSVQARSLSCCFYSINASSSGKYKGKEKRSWRRRSLASAKSCCCRRSRLPLPANICPDAGSNEQTADQS